MPYVKRNLTGFLILMGLAIFVLFAVMILLMTKPAWSASYRVGQPVMFGTYSQAYIDRQQAKRWRELCNGGGRYQAMSEAYEAGKPNPCR